MGAAKLAATVLVRDPDTHQTVELPEGTTPEMRLAVLVTNPVAWEGGRVPAAVARAAAARDDSGEGDGGQGNDSGSEDDDSGGFSPDDDADGSDPDADDPKPPAKKAAAKRTPSRGKAAAEGTGGQ